MIAAALLSWLTSDQGLMALVAQNWLLGSCVIAAVIFVETGMVIMPFLPGDTLLFATGTILALSGTSPWPTMLIVTLAAIAGDATNYAIGRSSLGQTIVRRQWIKPRHLAKAHAFFERYGGPTITIGRFIPLVRTLAPFLAGLAGMEPRRFLAYNVVGGVAWCTVMIAAGYWLGQVAWVQAHPHWLSVAIVALTLIPVGWHALSDRLRRSGA